MYSIIHKNLHLIIYTIIITKIIIIVAFCIRLYLIKSIPNPKERKFYDKKVYFIQDKADFILRNIVFIILIIVLYPRKDQTIYLNKDLIFSLFIYFILIFTVSNLEYFFNLNHHLFNNVID